MKKYGTKIEPAINSLSEAEMADWLVAVTAAVWEQETRMVMLKVVSNILMHKRDLAGPTAESLRRHILIL